VTDIPNAAEKAEYSVSTLYSAMRAINVEEFTLERRKWCSGVRRRSGGGAGRRADGGGAGGRRADPAGRAAPSGEAADYLERQVSPLDPANEWID
jgi:hypothetical protein